MGQKLREDKIGNLSHNAGDIAMSASSGSPAWLSIGGQQYRITSNLVRTITTDVTLTLQNLYYVYAVISGGIPVIRISTNVNSVGPSGFSSWLLIGAFYTNTAAAFNHFVSKNSETQTTTVLITTIGVSTYTLPPKTLELYFKMVGGGQGGTGSGAGFGGGAPAGDTWFNSNSFLKAEGGNSGTTNIINGTGLISVLSTSSRSPEYGFGQAGGTTHANSPGAAGAGTPFGSGGTNYYLTGNAASSFGSGGSGGGSGAAVTLGNGGASGGYVEAILVNPTSASYSVGIGAGTVGGTAGASGYPGGAGAQGVILITEIKPNLQYLKDL